MDKVVVQDCWSTKNYYNNDARIIVYIYIFFLSNSKAIHKKEMTMPLSVEHFFVFLTFIPISYLEWKVLLHKGGVCLTGVNLCGISV